MSFQEKSAWAMTVSLLVGGVFYFGVITVMSTATGQLVQPTLPVVGAYTMILIIVAILGHIAIAVFVPKDTDAPLDERERRIFDRAGHVASYVFGFGGVLSLGFYFFSHSGDCLFYSIFASLMLGQLAQYAIRIFYYRLAV